MKVESVAIDSIYADPSNVRTHPERNLATIKASLARFGQQTPIVVDASGIVRKGNGTLTAALELGWEKINVVRTPLKGSEATAYSIADNRTSDLAEWDDAGLAEQLRALQSEDFDLAAVGYDAGEIDAMIERLAGELVDDPQGEWQGMPEFKHEDLTSFRKIIVHFKDTEAVKAFESLVGQLLGEKIKAIWFPASDANIGREFDKQYVS